MVIDPSFGMALSLLRKSGITSSINKFTHNEGSQIFRYFGLKRKKLRNFEKLRHQADIRFFEVKLAGVSFLWSFQQVYPWCCWRCLLDNVTGSSLLVAYYYTDDCRLQFFYSAKFLFPDRLHTMDTHF